MRKYILSWLVLIGLSTGYVIADVVSNPGTGGGGGVAGTMADGSVGTPGLPFTLDPDTGFYRVGADILGISAGGFSGLTVAKSTGSFANVGMGTAASTSDQIPLTIARSNTSAGTYIAVSNTSTSANAFGGIQVIGDNAQVLGNLSSYTAAATIDAYISAVVLRASGTATKLSLAAPMIKFYTNNATLTTAEEAMRLNADFSMQMMQQIATPATPAANSMKIYQKAGDNLYSMNDAGVEQLLSAWNFDADGIYNVPASGDNVRIGASAMPGSGSTAQLIVSYPATDNQVAFFRSTTATHGALGVLPLGDIAGTAFDFSADLQAFTSANSAVAIMNLNRQGGIVNIGSAIGNIKLTAHTNCTALTTDASNVVGCTTSDERLKKDIVPFERGLEALKDIKPITFKFKSPSDMGVEHSGFSAQNVEKSISEAVRIGSDGNRMIDYWAIIAAQTNAINELRARLEALEGPSAKVVKKAIPQKPIWVAPKPETGGCQGSKAFCARKK